MRPRPDKDQPSCFDGIGREKVSGTAIAGQSRLSGVNPAPSATQKRGKWSLSRLLGLRATLPAVPTTIESLDRERQLIRLQIVTLTLLFCGYAAYYFCRSDFSVALPLLIDELHRHGMNTKLATVRLGALASFGVLAYAMGKFLLGGLGDLWGGKRSLLIGLSGAVAATVLFTLGGGLPVFTIAWIANRLVQSMGWAGAVKVCSKWFAYTSYGIALGILSLSFLAGDALARESMGLLIQAGLGWRALFYFAAAVALLVLIVNVWMLRESRVELGFSEPQVNPLNAFVHDRAGEVSNLQSFLRPLLTSRAFWLVCVLSLGTTIVRETFNTWTPTYLHQLFHFAEADSAQMSALFPATGVVSVLIAGWAGDKLGAAGRAVLFTLGLAITVVALAAMTVAPHVHPGAWPEVLLCLAALGLLGPYSYLAGAMALDFGGRKGGATASGIIDGVGYLGAMLAGDPVARLATSLGWQSVFGALAALSSVCVGVGGALYLMERRQLRESYSGFQ